MKRINLTIDDVPVEVEQGTTILEAAKKVNIDIPTLCHHPALKIEGACRICVVEVEGKKNLVPACAHPAEDGMVVRTNTPFVRKTRQMILELLIADHPQDCLICSRHGQCELQELSQKLGVRQIRFDMDKEQLPPDHSSPAIVRDPAKCILCARCVRVCQQNQLVGAIGHANRGAKTVVGPAFDFGLAEVSCVGCGQCIAVCPVAALREKDDTEVLWEALHDPDKFVVAQVAPAVRAAIGEMFGLRKGSLVSGKLVNALRKLGFDRVFDTQFAADVTILEEGHEFMVRLQNGGKLPLITSCSPGWVNYCETFFPELLDNLSSCKSPQQIFGALAKTYFAKKEGIDPDKIFVASIMPCTAKKMEAARNDINATKGRDVDVVITTRELASMFKVEGIDFAALPESMFDLPLGMSSGAGTIFGVTGGVMEAALRTVYELLTGEELEDLEFHAVRGFGSIKRAEVNLKGQKIKVAVASGLGAANQLLQRVVNGEEEYHFIEIMGCPGGCIMGGGQPLTIDPEIRERRAAALYRNDLLKKIRKSHENPAVQHLYKEYLGKPNSRLAHQLLHTVYRHRERI